MKQSKVVYKNPEECKAAMKSMALQRKNTGDHEVFLANGMVRLDNVVHFDNVKATVIRRAKGSPKPPPRQLVGTPFEAYYLAGGESDEKSRAEAANAIANGIDPRLIRGLLLDVGYTKGGQLCAFVTNAFRTSEDGTPSYRYLNLETGVLVAMSVGCKLNISDEKLKADGDKYDALRKKKVTGPALPGLAKAAGIETEDETADENQAAEAPIQASAAQPSGDMKVEIVEGKQAGAAEDPQAEPEQPKPVINPLVEQLKALSNKSLGL